MPRNSLSRAEFVEWFRQEIILRRHSPQFSKTEQYFGELVEAVKFHHRLRPTDEARRECWEMLRNA